MENLERLKEVFKNVVSDDADVSEITEQTGLFTDLGMNSIAMLYMALAVEDEFGISFTNEDFTSFQTVGDVLKFIENK